MDIRQDFAMLQSLQDAAEIGKNTQELFAEIVSAKYGTER